MFRARTLVGAVAFGAAAVLSAMANTFAADIQHGKHWP
jgi:hypothetical protein